MKISKLYFVEIQPFRLKLKFRILDFIFQLIANISLSGSLLFKWVLKGVEAISDETVDSGPESTIVSTFVNLGEKTREPRLLMRFFLFQKIWKIQEVLQRHFQGFFDLIMGNPSAEPISTITDFKLPNHENQNINENTCFLSGKTAGRPGNHVLRDSLTYFDLLVGSTTSIRKYFATFYFYFYFLSIGYRYNPFKVQIRPKISNVLGCPLFVL